MSSYEHRQRLGQANEHDDRQSLLDGDGATGKFPESKEAANKGNLQLEDS